MFVIKLESDFKINYKRYGTTVTQTTTQLAALKISQASAGKYIQEIANRTRLAVKLAKQYAPVSKDKKSGTHLYKTIWGRAYLSKNKLRVRCVITVGADYAPYREFGTRYSAATPFLRPAVMEAYGDLISQRKLQKAISIKRP